MSFTYKKRSAGRTRYWSVTAGVIAVGLVAGTTVQAANPVNLIIDPQLNPPADGTNTPMRGDTWDANSGSTPWVLNPSTSGPTGVPGDTCIFGGTTFCGNATGTALADWPNTNPASGHFVSAPPNGSNAFADPLDQSKSVTLQQSISGLVINQKYTLTFSEAGFALSNGGSTPITEYWQVTFGDPNTAGDVQSSTSMAVDASQIVDWQTQTMTFTAHAITQTLAFITAPASNAVSQFAALSNVSLTQVPEPASLGLFGVALAGFAAIRRRRVQAKT